MAHFDKLNAALGFGKVKAKKNEQLVVESMVRKSNLEPAVVLKWGIYEGYLTPDEAVAHAMGVFEAAAAAKSDSAVTKLFSSLEGLDISKAALFRRMLREFRNDNKSQDMAGVRVILDPEEEPVPVTELKAYAGYLLTTAIMSQTEAFLIEYLRQKLELDEDRINSILGELRTMMFPTTEKEDKE